MTAEQKLVLFIGAGLFGLLLGSFLNVCIFRLPRQCMSIWKQTRSRCPKCRAFIAWYDNFPVVSWLVLKGRCRACRNPISPRYVVVELLTGGLVLWLAAARFYPGGPAGIASGYHPTPDDFQQGLLWASQVYLVAALIVSAFIDFDFRILPDEINYSGLFAGLAMCTAFPFLHLGAPIYIGEFFTQAPGLLSSKIGSYPAAFAASALGAGAGAGMTYFIRLVGTPLFRREAMGLGDVKLMAFLGAWLGWRAILITFMLGCLFGSIYGLVQLPFTRKMGEIWFGPFLALGALLFVVAGHTVDRVLETAIAALRARTEWMVQQGPVVTVAIMSVPFAILVWMLVRIWRRSRQEPDDPPQGGTA